MKNTLSSIWVTSKFQSNNIQPWQYIQSLNQPIVKSFCVLDWRLTGDLSGKLAHEYSNFGNPYNVSVFYFVNCYCRDLTKLQFERKIQIAPKAKYKWNRNRFDKFVLKIQNRFFLTHMSRIYSCRFYLETDVSKVTRHSNCTKVPFKIIFHFKVIQRRKF